MPFGFPDTFSVEPPSNAWPQGSMPAFHADEAKKKEFGIALAKEQIPFNAACSICGDDTKAALWIVANWISDPVVIAAKDLYLKSVELDTTLLDKDQLGSRLLKFAEEKVKIAGKDVYISEAKDRLKALELYAEIMGFKKTTVDNSVKTFAITKLKVVVVEPKSTTPETVIEHDDKPIQQVKDKDALPLKLKLVG